MTTEVITLTAITVPLHSWYILFTVP